MSIFKQDNFTLKDFCTTFENISDEINIISLCYKKFSSSDNNYIKYLINYKYFISELNN